MHVSLKGRKNYWELLKTIEGAENGKKKSIDKLFEYVRKGEISTDTYNQLKKKYEIKREERKKRTKKALLIGLLLLFVCLACIITTLAHSGRTDSSGGHRDNNNKSGLGSYHYHCDGYPAHLHTNGVCPYTSRGYSASTSSSESHYNYEGDIAYEESYDYGYEKGYEYGYDEGHSEGYSEGYNEGYDKGYEVGEEYGYDKREDEYNASEKEADAERKAKKETLINGIIYSAIGLFVVFLIVKCFEKGKQQ